MAQLRIRITGSDDDARAISNLLTSIDGFEHVEEISDLMPHMDDPDSSSAGLPDDQGPGMQLLEIETPNPSTHAKVRDAVRTLAANLDVMVEFESDEYELANPTLAYRRSTGSASAWAAGRSSRGATPSTPMAWCSGGSSSTPAGG